MGKGCFSGCLSLIGWLFIWIIIAAIIADKNLALAGWAFFGGLFGLPILYVILKDLYTKTKSTSTYKLQKYQRYRDKLVKNATVEEIRFGQILENHNIKYIFQKGFYISYKLYIVDFYLPNSKICIEIDGIEHLNKRTIDAIREKAILKKYKTNFLRFNNFEINKSNERKIVERINLASKGELLI